MADGRLCQRCHARPAVARVRRVRSGLPPIVQELCEVCLAEGRMTPPGFGRSGLFDEFFREFFGGTGGPSGTGAGQSGIPGTQGPAGPQGPGAPQGPQPPPEQPIQQVDITRFFSDATRRLLQQAAQQAVEWGSLDLDSDHLLWGTLQDDAVKRVIASLDADAADIGRRVGEQVDKSERTGVAPSLSPDAKRVLLAAFEESRAVGVNYIGPEHVLLALTRDTDTAAGRLLAQCGVTHERLQPPVARGMAAEERERRRTDTPNLDQHSRDLTRLAEEGKLDPVIGRADEIEQTIEILSRRTKNNPVLIGEAGVGKTAIAEGIAQRIVTGDVPETLEGKRLVGLDLAGMLAGTRYRGEFEERMKNMLEEISRHAGELLLFIDEIHTIVGAGAAEGAMDAANMLKPALARGELHAIGATTLDEYRKNIERDPALERRFQPVHIGEPSVAETVQILYGLKDRYEAFHRVRITDEAIEAAAELSDRYVTDRFLPDKAIDLIDQAGARVRLRHRSKSEDTKALEDEIRQLERDKDQAVAAEEYERAGELRTRIGELQDQIEERRTARQRAPEVTGEDIAEVVSRATGIPVSQLTQEERDRLLKLEDRLHERVIDQAEAITAVAEAVRRSRAGLGDPNRPVGSFLFLGPTGVGKTETARALAEALFGDQDLMIRFDMSEFQERHTVSRLVGAPPGYVGYEEAGQLTEQIRRRPYSVVLLDEIEKAHPDVFNALLQVLDDGRLTDAQGRTVDFKNTVVVMTSNMGSERITAAGQPFGFTPRPTSSDEPFQQVKQDLRDLLRRELRPEFLNRIDEIVVFRPLTEEQLHEITRLLVDRLTRRLAAKRIDVAFTDAAIDHLAHEGFDAEFGARPLRRTIQRSVENELSRMLLDGSLDPGDRVTVEVADGSLAFDVTKGANADGEDYDNWQERQSPHEPATSGPSAPRR